MKIPLIALLLCAAPSWAGKRLVMDATLNGVKQRTELLIEPARLRINLGNQASMIFLTDGGKLRLLAVTPASNEYIEIGAEFFAQLQGMLDSVFAKLPAEMREQVKQQMQAATAKVAIPVPPKMVLNGERVVKGFPCKVYETMEGDQKVREVCIASAADLGISAADAGVFGLMRKFSEDLMKSMAQLPISLPVGGFDQYLNMFPEARDGQAVQMIQYANGKVSSEDVIQLVEDAIFTDADFSTGSAVKRELPTLPF